MCVRPVLVEFFFGEGGVAIRADSDADEFGWGHDDRFGDCTGSVRWEDICPKALGYERTLFVSHDIMMSL
jgi:hypothetical protein